MRAGSNPALGTNFKQNQKERNEMKSLLCASVIIASAIPAIAFGFGNGRCNNAGVRNSTYITVIDTLKAWNGQTIVQLCEISGHEYIIARAAS